MKNATHQLLTLFFVLWMSLLGTAASAEDSIVMLLTTDSTGIDTTYYTTFPSALKKANKYPQASIVLLDDVRFGGKAGSQAIKTNLTIDLNGYTIGDTLSSTSLFSLAIDTLTLHITSSRPGGLIAVNRAYNGRIYAISCSKGKLLLDHITIDARNTAVYDDYSCKSVAVTGISVGAAGSAQISECSIYAAADGTVTAVGGSGSAGKSAQLDIRSCSLHAYGQQKVYGVNCYSTVFITDCEVDVSASFNPAYGLLVNNRFDSLLMQDVRANIRDTRVRVASLKQAYGIYTRANTVLASDTIAVQTANESATGLYISSDTIACHASQTSFTAETR